MLHRDALSGYWPLPCISFLPLHSPSSPLESSWAEKQVNTFTLNQLYRVVLKLELHVISNKDVVCFRWYAEHSWNIGIHRDMWGNTFDSWRAAIVDCWSCRTYHYHVYVSLQLCQGGGRFGRTAIFGLGWMVGIKIDYTRSCDSFGIIKINALCLCCCWQGLYLDCYHVVFSGNVQCFQCD